MLKTIQKYNAHRQAKKRHLNVLAEEEKHIQVPTDKHKKRQLPVLQNLDAHVITCPDSLKLQFELFHRFKVILRCTLKIFYSITAELDDSLYTGEQEAIQCFVERYLSQQIKCIRAENNSKLHKRKTRKNLLE